MINGSSGTDMRIVVGWCRADSSARLCSTPPNRRARRGTPGPAYHRALDEVTWSPGEGARSTPGPWPARTPSSTSPAPASVTTAGPRPTSGDPAQPGRRDHHDRPRGRRRLPASDRPEVLLNASAIGFYGDRGDERARPRNHPPATASCPTSAGPGRARRTTAEDAGVRVVHLRTGLVLGPGGGDAGPDGAAVQGGRRRQARQRPTVDVVDRRWPTRSARSASCSTTTWPVRST